MKYVAYVKVWGGDDQGWYWNPLAAVRLTYKEAEADVQAYKDAKRAANRAPGETRISSR